RKIRSESRARQRGTKRLARRAAAATIRSVDGESDKAARTSGLAALLAAAYFQADLILPALSARLVDPGRLHERMFSKDCLVHKAPVRFDDLRIFSG
ncbi:MAG: hypothetical protein QOJ15_9464, partial [Bradyrhizobium sp.]|nr:hypothetical protein [Bradyrhizobium sp.]